MSAAAVAQPKSCSVPMSAMTATRSGASPAGASAARKGCHALALPVSSVTEYAYCAPGVSPVMTALNRVPVQPALAE